MSRTRQCLQGLSGDESEEADDRAADKTKALSASGSAPHDASKAGDAAQLGTGILAVEAGIEVDPSEVEQTWHGGSGRESSSGGTNEWDAADQPVFEEGRIVFGKYQLLQKLGEGGMGQVWLVENIQLERQSALKLIKTEIAQNEAGWRRFKREARLMAKLTHPNAVAVFDFARTHSICYIEMEFVRGQSLDKYIAEFKGHANDASLDCADSRSTLFAPSGSPRLP